MSTFNGVILEIPDISVDNFAKECYFAKAFFLSHIHSDHLCGLLENDFVDHLKENNKFIYTSELTKLMLEQKLNNYGLSDMKPFVKSLGLKYPTLISEVNISVSLLPSGHCAGAVMFFFETNTKRILYTGDIRIENNGLNKYRILHTFDETVVKQIDALYLDTTFLNPDYNWFPLRAESSMTICHIIEDWLNKNTNNLVFIKIPAICGSEQLFIEIYKNLKKQVFINRLEYENIVSQIPEMDGVFTFDEKLSQIHASQKFQCCERCRQNVKLQIFPSALYWTKDKFRTEKVNEKNFVSYTNSVQVRICYSCHSSYSEIKELLCYLKPKRIVACVTDEKEFVQEFVNNYNETIKKSACVDNKNMIDELEILILKPLNKDSDNDSESSDDSLLLSTPPKKCSKFS